MSTIHQVLVAAVLAATLGACAGQGAGERDEPAVPDSPAPVAPGADADDPAAEAGASAVSIQGLRFEPARLEVRAGTTVTWTNEDDLPHTVTAGVPGEAVQTFDIAFGGAGETGSQTFDEPGSYPYFCRFHESMRGEVVVE